LTKMIAYEWREGVLLWKLKECWFLVPWSSAICILFEFIFLIIKKILFLYIFMYQHHPPPPPSSPMRNTSWNRGGAHEATSINLCGEKQKKQIQAR
jgi:hypothetical protein